MRVHFPWLFFLCLLLAFSADAAEPLHTSSFAPGGWHAADWILVKSPRWSHRGTWRQEEASIRNATPIAATARQLYGARVGETYTSMVLQQTFKTSVVITSTLSFEDRMAPLIVLAPELGKDAEGYPEYREHFEIVFWDEGVNIWHHRYADGKPSWKLAAYCRFKLEPKTRHAIEVTYAKGDGKKMLSVRAAGHEFGHQNDDLPDVFHVGLTGCEGINRFYNFSVGPPPKP